jgi:serine/threonine protein kinase
MGSLYLAKDPKIGRLVAIKLVRQEFDSPDARQRFAREAQSAGTLRHTNIVTIFDVDEHDGLPFIAMEYIDGETLGEIVKRKALLPIPKRIQWVEDLCSGLAYAHRQGVIHRDIKPANLMVDTEGTLKILDFGLARRDASKFTQSHVIIGTPNYMSPEQIRGQNIDTRSDIFAVGALFYEVLTYKEAFPGAVHQTMHKILHEEPEALDNFIPDADPQLARILARAIVKDRDGRYPDLLAMRNDLTEVRQRMETSLLTDAATMPLSRDARFQAPPTGPITRAGAPSSSHGSSRTGSSRSSKRFQTNRQSLQRRRSEQITTLLDEARKLFEEGKLEPARNKCDEALMFDPDHPGGLQLMDDIIVESDRQAVAKIIGEARAEIQKGQLDRAEALVADARQMSPESSEVQQLQEAIDTTRREIERTRQIQETMRRARARFAEGGFEAAIRAAGEVLASDPENAAAKDLQQRAQLAIESQKNRGERDAAAQSAVANARKLFETGDKDGAIQRLEAFTPKHDLVTAFLATLKGEKVPELETPTGGDTAHILRGARGETPDLPARRNFLVAAAVFIVVVVGVTLYFRPWERAEPNVATNLSTDPSPGNATAAAPPVEAPPPLPPVTAPVSATTENTQDSKDVLAVYALLTKNDIPGAQKLYAAIRKRNPKYDGLADLNTAIGARAADIRKQEEAIKATEESNARSAALLEEERKRTAAAVKEAEDAKAEKAPVMSVAPGGAFIAPSEPPSPLLLGEVERPAIDKAIQQWAAAFAKLDVQALSQVRTLTQEEANNWKRTFGNMSAYKMNVRLIGMPQVVDTDAIAPVEEIAVYTGKRGGGISITQQPVKTNYRLRKIGGEWKLLVPTTPMPKPPNPSQ